MENKKSKNKLYIIIFVSLLLIVFGSAFIYDKFFDSKNNKDTNNKIVINKKINDKNVPYINLSCDEVNEKIKDTYKILNNYKPKYDYYLNNDILSLVISFESDEEKVYKTFNINIKNKEEISNSELMKLSKVEGSIGTLLESIFDSELIKEGTLNNYRRTHMYGDEFTSIYDASIMEFDSIKLDSASMYLNSDNELCLIGKIYDLESAKTITKIFNLSKKIYEK